VRDSELPGFFVLIGKRRKTFMAQGEFWRDGVREFTTQVADSDDLARVYRFDLAQDSEMISPTIPI
jgi:hypothetical protein